MPQKGDIYLGLSGQEVYVSPIGRNYSISTVEISRGDRTASGRFVKDIVAVKHQITLAYKIIDGDQLATFEAYYLLKTELSFLHYTGTSIEQYTVLMQPIDKERILLQDTGLWSGVKIVLEEV